MGNKGGKKDCLMSVQIRYNSMFRQNKMIPIYAGSANLSDIQ